MRSPTAALHCGLRKIKEDQSHAEGFLDRFPGFHQDSEAGIEARSLDFYYSSSESVEVRWTAPDRLLSLFMLKRRNDDLGALGCRLIVFTGSALSDAPPHLGNFHHLFLKSQFRCFTPPLPPSPPLPLPRSRSFVCAAV